MAPIPANAPSLEVNARPWQPGHGGRASFSLTKLRPQRAPIIPIQWQEATKRLTENELSDFSRLWHDGCVEAITEAQDVDRNHSAEVSAKGTTLRKRCDECRMGAD